MHLGNFLKWCGDKIMGKASLGFGIKIWCEFDVVYFEQEIQSNIHFDQADSLQ